VGPKKPLEPDKEGLAGQLARLEEYIKDYIIQGSSDDPILEQYIALVTTAEVSGAPIFSIGVLERPALWERFVRPWITEGFQELSKLKQLAKPPV
jgi:hypothetical protein